MVVMGWWFALGLAIWWCWSAPVGFLMTLFTACLVATWLLHSALPLGLFLVVLPLAAGIGLWSWSAHETRRDRALLQAQ